MAKHYVKCSSQMMKAYNLPSSDENGRRLSVILARGEVSRPLTDEEFSSAEIQKGLAARDLLDVTKQVTR